MVELPPPRLNQVEPFRCIGVDFGGPFLMTMCRIWGAKYTKAYLCLFVCFAVKALHLEFVSDLSSESLQTALKRFIEVDVNKYMVMEAPISEVLM